MAQALANKRRQRLWATVLGYGLLTAVLTVLFVLPATRNADSLYPTDYDSEANVLARVEYDRLGLNDSIWGLMQAEPEQSATFQTYNVSAAELPNVASTSYKPYESALGIQAYGASWAYKLGAHSLHVLHLLDAFLLAVVISFLTWVFFRVTNRLFTALFLLTVVGGPPLLGFADNPYWVEWTWWLPIALSGLYLLAKTTPQRIWTLVGIGAAFAVRWACGYEYLTSFTLAAVLVPILAVTIGRFRSEMTYRRMWQSVLWIFVAAVGAFAVVITVHALLRGDGSFVQGLQTIIREDVMRRTYGNPNDFPEIYRASLNANSLQVLAMYLFQTKVDFLVFGWKAPWSLVFGPLTLFFLIVASLSVVLWQAARGRGDWKNNALLLVMAAAIPVSWFIFGKSHAYIHIHISMFLWYLLFAAVVIYIPVRAVLTWGAQRFPGVICREARPHD